MKKKLLTIFILQLIAIALWIMHSHYLSSTHAERLFKLGVIEGKSAILEEIQQKGGTIPEGIYVTPSKSLVLNLDAEVHQFFILYPLYFIQALAMIVLVHTVLRDPGKTSLIGTND